MKRIFIALLISLSIGLEVSCSAFGGALENNQVMIEPGDKIDDFTITNGKLGEFTWAFNEDCSRSGENNTYTFSCSATVGETVSVAFRNFSPDQNSLEDIWYVSNYRMTINDRQVDLEAFGTIDFNLTFFDTKRFWNVVITTEKPGKITIKDSGVFNDGRPFSSSWTYTFIEP